MALSGSSNGAAFVPFFRPYSEDISPYIDLIHDRYLQWGIFRPSIDGSFHRFPHAGHLPSRWWHGGGAAIGNLDESRGLQLRVQGTPAGKQK